MDDADDFELKKVETSDLPMLHRWLANHLPDTWKLWSSVREAMSGRWPWGCFYVLCDRSDNIVAVGEGPPDETCPAYLYYTTPRNVCAFGVSPRHVKILLNWPGFTDWNKSVLFFVVPKTVGDIVEEHVKLKECSKLLLYRHQILLMVADPGDVELLPVPDGLTLKPLDPDLHKDLVDTSWRFRRNHSDEYIRVLIQRFPSLGLFDRDGKCLAFELSTEIGTLGHLYVIPEARGQGLSKVISSHLAHILFSENRPAAVTVMSTNEVSVKLHESLGFKVRCRLSTLINMLPHEFNYD
ncbi:unnamed protein product [Lymnaea stagnalis]|uniref:Glycine N-acyltransferase-like protein n=1 Tax=Lymnaea stagnalis TaxID=6523 RepID=A0AAV2IES6_LYMST